MQTRLLLGLLLAAVAVAPAAAQPQPYPAKPIHLVVGGAPGGGWDLAARVIADKMTQQLGQPVIIENKPGADGILAAREVAAAASDGYTLMPAVSAQMTMNPVVQSKLPYDPFKSFEPVSLIGMYPLLVVASPSLPVNNVRELIAYSKSRPNGLDYGSGSSGFMYATELLKSLTGAELRRIPYKGSAQTVNALLAGDVQVAIVDVAPALPQVKAGKLKALAVTTPQRVSFLPDVPTVAESGVSGYDVVLWIGMYAPAGTPPEVVSRLQSSIAHAVEAPDVRDRLVGSGIVPASSTPQALAERMHRDIDQITTMWKAGKLSAD